MIKKYIIFLSILILLLILIVLVYISPTFFHKEEVMEIIPSSEILKSSGLIVFMKNINKYNTTYTFSTPTCAQCIKRNITVKGYFIFLKKPLPFFKDNARLVLRNITIVYNKWPLEEKISDSIALGFLTDRPLRIIYFSKNNIIVSFYAYNWIGIRKGFNDIKPTSKVYMFSLDSYKLRGLKNAPKDIKAIAIFIIPPYPPTIIKYIDFSHAYFAYVKN